VSSRREQLQAYRFVTRRIVSAVLSGEPESNDLPMRRLAVAAFASVMIGALVFGAYGAYGLLRPGGNQSWRHDNALVIEKESGARYVYRGERLHPVLNYASARLVIGSPKVEPFSVSRNSLKGVARGRPIGIAGAPDDLPSADTLLGLPWSVCASRKIANVEGSVAVALVVGQELPGGSKLDARGLLVKNRSGEKYLVWRDHRLRLPGRASETALGWDGNDALDVGAAFLNSVPAGPELTAPKIPDIGGAGREVDGRTRRVGELFQVEQPDGSRQFYVMLRDGLSRLDEVAFRLLTASPDVAALYPGRQPVPAAITSTAVTGAGTSDVRVEPTGLPGKVPVLAEPPSGNPAVCAGYDGGEGPKEDVTITLYDTVPPALAAGDDAVRAQRGAEDTVTVDMVLVSGGKGAVVQSSESKTRYIVTDQGRKYGVPSEEALTSLGYGEVTPVTVPSGLLDLLPTGPALDPAAAGQFADQPPTPPASPASN